MQVLSCFVKCFSFVVELSSHLIRTVVVLEVSPITVMVDTPATTGQGLSGDLNYLKMMTCLTYLLKSFYFIIIFALLINNFNLYSPLLFNSLFDNYSNSNYYIECLKNAGFSSFYGQT